MLVQERLLVARPLFCNRLSPNKILDSPRFNHHRSLAKEYDYLKFEGFINFADSSERRDICFP